MENRKDTFKKLSEVLRKDHRFNTTKREALRIQFSKEKMVEETLKSYS
jgi:hypothetical protein